MVLINRKDWAAEGHPATAVSPLSRYKGQWRCSSSTSNYPAWFGTPLEQETSCFKQHLSSGLSKTARLTSIVVSMHLPSRAIGQSKGSIKAVSANAGSQLDAGPVYIRNTISGAELRCSPSANINDQRFKCLEIGTNWSWKCF